MLGFFPKSRNPTGDPTGADVFLPLLGRIYCIILNFLKGSILMHRILTLFLFYLFYLFKLLIVYVPYLSPG